MTMKKQICSVCGKEFELPLKKYTQKIRENTRFYCSKECLKMKSKVKLQCSTCGKDVYRTPSQISHSKHGNFFCNKSCSATFTNKMEHRTKENHPNYTNGYSSYRSRALDEYKHECSVCSWNEDPDVLEIHHIDENRGNNDIKNLIILCPICHRKITIGKYKLDVKSSKILKKEDI